MIQNGQHKAEFWCFLYREKQPIFLLRVSLFFNEGIQTTQHIPRASENFPLEKSLWVHGKTTKKLMEVPLFAFLPLGPCHHPFYFLHVSSQFQTFFILFSQSKLYFFHTFCKREGGKNLIKITFWHGVYFSKDEDSGQGWDMKGLISGKGSRRGEMKGPQAGLFGHSLLFPCLWPDLSQLESLLSQECRLGFGKYVFLVIISACSVFKCRSMTECTQVILKNDSLSPVVM